MFDRHEFLNHFEKVRHRTERVVTCSPADRAEWTCRRGGFTLGDIVRHIAVTERNILGTTGQAGVSNRQLAR
jgi:hypothetical protein